MAQENTNAQTQEVSIDTKEVLDYQSKKVVVKKAPEKGQNIAVFVRPGDNVEYALDELDLDSLEYRLVGGDIVVTMPNGGLLTFVSMALMGYNDNPPSLLGANGKQFNLGQVLSQINEINDLPLDSMPVEANIQQEDKVKKIVEEFEETIEKLTKNIAQQEAFTQLLSNNDNTASQNEKYTNPDSLHTNDFAFQPPATPFVESNSFTGYYDKPIYQSKEKLPEIKEEVIPKNDYTNYHPDPDAGNGDGIGDSVDDGEGNVEDAAKPIFYFKGTAHQVTFSEITNDEGNIEILGGTGSANGYKFSSITNQYEAETIDISARSENLIVRADNPNYLNDTKATDTYLSRVLRFEPQMPEGFYINSFSLGTLPAGVVILDKNGDKITGTTISKEDMILKDSLGNIIDFNDADFIDKFKSIEFTIKYTNPDSLPSQFDIAITANYQLSSAYTDTTDLAPNQTYTNTYTFALKDITSANDYTYKQSDYASGQAEGFILAKEANYNIIKDGSGDNTIYGSIGKDVIYDATGDDTVYLSGGNDTLYAGAGTNIINGDTYIAQDDSLYTYNDGRDKVSYENVQSFSLAELEFLKTKGKLSDEDYGKLTSGTGTLLDDMTNYYKGVYVDLNGISELAVDIDGDGTLDDIHSLSKFALKDANSFTYDANGNISETTITQSGLSNLQNIGQDNLSNIEDIDGSNYNDTIYGNASSNILSGLGGSDILDGREGGNTLYGGSGYDTLLSGTGDDTIHGGDDTDAVSYINSSTGVVVRLDKPNGDEYDDFATGHGTDTLISIEDVIGSNQTDTIFGSGGTNYIMAMGGDDSIFAGKGYDFIDGGDGSDWLSYYIPDYNERVDNPNYMEDIQGITVAMGTDFVMLKETSTGRLIDLVKNIEQVRGTSGVDTIWGDGSNEIFWGHEGNDDLRGNGGNDTLYGGAGNDYIRPGAGLDTSYGGEGVDYLELYDDVVVANQRLRLDENGKVEHSTDTTNGTDGNWTDGYNANGGINLAYGFEGYSGGNSADTLYGNTQNNVINGHNGDDKIYGLEGNDTLNGGNGNDSLEGGEGNDTLNGGNDNDTLNGGNGDDLFIGTIRYNTSTDADSHDGGDGVDTLDYSITNHNYAMTVTFSGVGAGTITFGGSAANTTNYQDTFANMERLITSRANDVINASADTTGMYLDGMGGTDTITGGSGDDTIIARNTAGETLNGGEGTDILQLAQSVNFTNANASVTNNITVSDFEVLDLGNTNYYTRLNINQWNANNFNKIIGGDNTRLFLHATNNGETFDLDNVNMDEFSGAIYMYGYNGNDTIDLTHVSDIDDVYFYLNAGGGTDTLELGNNQTLKLLDNTYNTFEDFDIDVGSTLEVSAYNDTNRTFNAYNNKDFSDVAGEINFIGKNGNDTFQLDFTALDSGKFTVEGGLGTDIVDIRNVTSDISFDSADASMFSNIEQLRLSSISNSHNITLSAEALANWSSENSLTLDLSNNTQGTKVTITDSVGADITHLTIGSSYSITSDTGDTLNLSVV